MCTTSWAVLRLLMSPSVTQSTGGLPFRLDQILGSRPLSCEVKITMRVLSLFLASSTTYYYCIIAVDSAGDSPASNMASATTLKKGK